MKHLFKLFCYIGWHWKIDMFSNFWDEYYKKCLNCKKNFGYYPHNNNNSRYEGKRG